MKRFRMTPVVASRVVVAAVLAAGLCGGANAVVFQCTSAAGETLFTDSSCPPGYSTDLTIREPEAPSRPATAQGAAAAEAAKVEAETAKAEAAKQAAAAEAARVAAELENARLRSELQQERLQAMDTKLDALLDAQSADQAVYGAVGVVRFGVAARPFPICRGKGGQTPWVNCRPARDDHKASKFVEQRPNCGITGCTPTINTCGIAGCTPTITRVPERDAPGRVRMR